MKLPKSWMFLVLIFAQLSAFGQRERITNHDFSAGISGAISYRPGSAWNEFDFERNERHTNDSEAENNVSLWCRDNKVYAGKDHLGIGQYHGRGQSIIPCPEPGTQYTLRARARMASGLSGEEPGEVAILFYDANGINIHSEILQFSNTTYQEKNKSFIVPANTVWSTVWVRKKETVDFYTDWVSLKASTDDTPDAVSNFTVSEVGSTRVLLNWTPVANARAYKIERKAVSEGYSHWKTIFISLENGAASSFLDTRESGNKILQANTSYNYRISALSDYGISPTTQLTASTLARSSSPGNTTYYIDASTGNDNNSGTSSNSPWKSFINIDKLNLAPGDKVLLRKGERWEEPLHIHGSGASGNSIVIGSYGSGGQRPEINVGGLAHAAIQMFDVSYIKVEDLEISNYHPFFRELFKFGIHAGAWQNSSVTDLEFDNLYINKVRGSAVRGGNLGSISGGELCAGIRVATDIRGTQPLGSTIYNVSITNSLLWEVEQHGIQLIGVDGITISNNKINKPGYISLLTNYVKNGTIDNNYFIKSGYYMTMADNAGLDIYRSDNLIIENNVIYRVYNDRSGQSINLDECDNNIVQYNFLRDSDSGSFVLNSAHDNIIRYNVSEGFNDEWVRNLGGVGTKIYNNTAFARSTNHALKGFFVRNDEAIGTQTPATNTQVYNNILVSESPLAENIDLIYEQASTTGSMFSHNVYFGNFTDEVVEDSNPFFDDPKMENPGSGTVNEVFYTYQAAGYKLKGDSPYNTSGMEIMDNGGFDFQGNNLPNPGMPSSGAFQQDLVLPIELMDFTAEAKGRTVLLKWLTSWEFNNYGFELQHSADGRDWQILSFIESKGDSDAVQGYTYTHSLPLAGGNFYRLKQIDFGSAEPVFSAIRTVYFEDELLNDIAVFPNPTGGQLNISSDNDDFFSCSLTDLSGKLVLVKDKVQNDCQFDLSALPEGIYILTLKNDNEFISKQISVIGQD